MPNSSPRHDAALRQQARWCALAALFFGMMMMASLVAQVGHIPAIASWKHRLPDFAEAVETLEISSHLSHRLTAQIVLEERIHAALRLLRSPRSPLEASSADIALSRIREDLNR